MTVKVVHWGTGNTGTMALKGIIGHPELELVGCYVARPERAGNDAGELIGLAPVGVTTTNDVDELLALEPACLSFFGVGPTSIDDVCRFLRAGVNVVTTSLAQFILPQFTPAAMIDPVNAASAAGNASLFATGVEPGIGSDLVPETLLSFVDEATYIHVREIAIYRHAGGASMRAFGFGIPAGETPALFVDNRLEGVWGGVARHLAQAIGRPADSIEIETDTWVTPTDIEMEWGVVPANHVGASPVPGVRGPPRHSASPASST